MHLEFETRVLEENQGYAGRCTQFPWLTCPAYKESEALFSIVVLVAKLVQSHLLRGEPLPEDCGPDRSNQPEGK